MQERDKRYSPCSQMLLVDVMAWLLARMERGWQLPLLKGRQRYGMQRLVRKYSHCVAIRIGFPASRSVRMADTLPQPVKIGRQKYGMLSQVRKYTLCAPTRMQFGPLPSVRMGPAWRPPVRTRQRKCGMWQQVQRY